MKRKYMQRLLGRDHFPVAIGRAISHDSVRGYYIDFTRKASVRPTSVALQEVPLHVMVAQWGLGCYERFLLGDGDCWLDAAITVGRHLVHTQKADGHSQGAWRHVRAFPHTFPLAPGWISGMAQGEAASLLVRLYEETGDDVFAQSALDGLAVLGRSVDDGGVCRVLAGGPIPEEYPTEPASYVLNGAIFAIWGYYDAAIALRDTQLHACFDAVVETIATNLNRWDLGFWSRYDLYPHPIQNPAAPWYHRLHIQQLQVLHRMTLRPEFDLIARRWQSYADARWKRSRAMLHKAAFRIAVPQ